MTNVRNPNSELVEWVSDCLCPDPRINDCSKFGVAVSVPCSAPSLYVLGMEVLNQTQTVDADGGRSISKGERTLQFLPILWLADASG